MTETERLFGKDYRRYPTCCISMSCGSVEPECRTCPNRTHKDDFNAWVEEHAAICVDKIWSPLLYKATR